MSTNKDKYSLVIKAINASDINWSNGSMISMVSAQKEINKIISENKLISDKTKSLLQKLETDMINFYSSECNICGDKQSEITHMNIEHMNFKVS